jgi:soluble lytic murein transglycosylase-like protein
VGWGALILAALVGGGAYLVATKKVIPVGGSKGTSQEVLLRQLAAKWAAVFGVPLDLVLSIIYLESGWKPQSVNTSDRAQVLGGAWGAMQVTKSTADGVVARLRKHPSPDVAVTLRRWTGKGADMYDPDLGVMLGTAYLGQLWQEFGDFILAAAAYHQGPGKIRTMRRLGQAIPAELPPYGKQYVVLATAARAKVA